LSRHHYPLKTLCIVYNICSQMTNNDSKDKDKAGESQIPKIPTLNFGYKKPSMFSGNKGFMPKGNPGAKFNQSTFHTQHKGGPSGGK